MTDFPVAGAFQGCFPQRPCARARRGASGASEGTSPLRRLLIRGLGRPRGSASSSCPDPQTAAAASPCRAAARDLSRLLRRRRRGAGERFAALRWLASLSPELSSRSPRRGAGRDPFRSHLGLFGEEGLAKPRGEAAAVKAEGAGRARGVLRQTPASPLGQLGRGRDGTPFPATAAHRTCAPAPPPAAPSCRPVARRGFVTGLPSLLARERKRVPPRLRTINGLRAACSSLPRTFNLILQSCDRGLIQSSCLQH